MNINRTKPIKHKSLEEVKYRELYNVTEKFHSTMDITSVLAEIIQTLQKVFPRYEYCLLMSNDHNNSDDLPIKELEYNSENVTAIDSYVNGTLKLENGECLIIYAPLKGKQGVYGVLQVQTDGPQTLKNSEIDFIRLLANTAGSALENAKLYQQSRKLIDDLRFINETSYELNTISSFKETIQYLATKVSSFFSASAICFVCIDEGVKVLKQSSDYFQKDDAIALIDYVYNAVQAEKDGIFIGDTAQLDMDIACLYGTIMAVPMVDGETIKGIAIAVGVEPYSFTFDIFRLFQSLIHRSSSAVTNSLLRGKLEKMVVTDYLTQLYARNYLNDAIALSMKSDRGGTFILMDLDDFKDINDTYGHQVGDEVLIQVANLIKGYLRLTDIGARWGGEEMAVYLPNVELAIGIQIAQRLREVISKATKPKVTVTFGISNWIFGQNDEVKHLFNRADTALYEAKRAGKNRINIKEVQSFKE
ncbi:sensor domain-containing diguanylate cyclase [Bacillus sp. FSL K6-3431]|uniref:sensor domain-containing diguanylate cyclase n=1 Tax=Bacillus sp. FSL K6-3431 TaxID=2921500 RepID=UPI0030FC5351